MIIVMTTVTTLLMVVAAIALFVRMRSKATALFLFGTLVTPVLLLIGYYIGIGSRANIGAGYTAMFLSIGPLCTGIGLLWHALTTPKSAVETSPIPPAA